MKAHRFLSFLIFPVVGCGNAASAEPPNEQAPEVFRVEMITSKGPVTIEVTRADAPRGADRFYNLVKNGFLDGDRFFRVVPGFVVQFGLAGDPNVNRLWQEPIKDDPVKASNVRGTIVFAAASEPNSRTTQLFINLGNNRRLDAMGFAPFGRVVSGMEAIDGIYSGDGERPDQGMIEAEGNDYLSKYFPRLDYIAKARLK